MDGADREGVHCADREDVHCADGEDAHYADREDVHCADREHVHCEDRECVHCAHGEDVHCAESHTPIHEGGGASRRLHTGGRRFAPSPCVDSFIDGCVAAAVAVT